VKSPYRKRIQVAVKVLSELTKRLNEIDRPAAVEILRKIYTEHRLQPIRGKATPPDIFDKEMATLYVISKYGLKLNEEHPELHTKIFYLEEMLDSVINSILSGGIREAREKLKSLSPIGVIDSNTVARLLRIPLIKLILGFAEEKDFQDILHRVREAIPEEEKTVINYVKFYISLKIAEAIFRGEIKSREVKEAYKKAIAIRLGFPKATPSDSYVFEIARAVFNISEKKLTSILSLERGKSTSQLRGEEPGEQKS
jgi:hypothetical protein